MLYLSKDWATVKLGFSRSLSLTLLTVMLKTILPLNVSSLEAVDLPMSNMEEYMLTV